MAERESLHELRARLAQVDEALVRLAADRVRLGRAVGDAKARLGFPTVDYAQERAVLERGRQAAREAGLDPTVAEEVLARLIRASVTAQEADRVRRAGVGSGKRAVVVGGAGRMGRWLVRFLADAGYRTAVLDPAATVEENAAGTAWLGDADLVVCATPPRLTAELYRAWCDGPPRGIVADISSIKTPLIGAIGRLRAAGARVASLHPMFGPATVLLRDTDVVVCDTGDAEATAAVEALFAPTTARVVRLPLDGHDRVMADLLALAHAAAIAFAAALPDAHHPVHSTTFHALERIAGGAAAESPEVYFEIQAANPHSAAAVARLRDVLDRLADAVARGDATAFAALMQEGKERTGAGR
jgi:chorismate mutase/prephenate dehydrogenase